MLVDLDTRYDAQHVVDLCARDGVVLAADLRRAGLSDSQIRNAASAGLLSRHLPGVYLLAGLELEHRRDQVALAYAGPGALLTGLSAARHHGLPWVPTTPVRHVLVPPDRRRRSRSAGWVLIRRSQEHSRGAAYSIGGVPVVAPAQAVVDGARELSSLRDVRGLVMGVVAARQCSAAQIIEILDRGAPAGTAYARRACRDADRGATSPPEAELVDALLRRGIPFYVNCGVYVDGRLLGIADVWLVGMGVGGEVDSLERHGSAPELDATLQRDKQFREHGLWLEHVTPQRFRAAPDAWVDQLLSTAARRRREGVREPEGLELRPTGPLLGVPRP